MADLHDLPHGKVITYDDNEVAIVSEIADPPKLRFGVRDTLVESNLGMLSCNTVRVDGEQDEWATIGARLTNNRSEGAIALCVRPQGREDVIEAVLITPRGVYFNVPLIGATQKTDTLYSGNGKYKLVMQGDGNIVAYRADGSVLWASNTNE